MRGRLLYIYFIEAPALGLVKIGKTHRLAIRLADLQVASPVELRLIRHMVASSLGDEKVIHDRFARYRVRGEWFRLEGEVQEYIQNTQDEQLTQAGVEPELANVAFRTKMLDEFVREGRLQFTLADAASRLELSAAATGNFLARLVRDGLLDRVRRGHYAIRQLGALGTTVASENVLLAVAAGFRDVRHRVAYRAAMDQLDLLTHPSRSIQIALVKPTRSEKLSGRRLTVVREPETAIGVGAKKQDGVFISDLERSLLDAAARPELVGGADVISEALGAASSKGVDVKRLTSYARVLSWGPALRRIGSLADTLHIAGLAGRLEPLSKPSSDMALEPGHKGSAYRDAKWWVRWNQSPSELLNAVRQ